ncbi:MAG: response regulator [Pseudomonadota bacterium]
MTIASRWRLGAPPMSPSPSAPASSSPRSKSNSPRPTREGVDVHTPAQILIADDNPDNLNILRARLAAHGYEVVTAMNGEEALALVKQRQPDLILLDYMMPVMDGIEVCRRIKGDPGVPFTPIIMVTAKAGTESVIAALDAGADEYLSKPIDQGALVARVKSMLRIKALTDTVQQQGAELARWNAALEQRVEAQLQQLERLSQLKRFFSPQLAEAIVTGASGNPLASHRREIVVVFLDLRGFTRFAETSEPEEVMQVLRGYHCEMGRLILEHEGTLERFTGDGMMIFFNDPVVVPNPAERAVRMAIAMRDRVAHLAIGWRKRGLDLALGIGIAQGYATIGAIGFEGRLDYAAIGTVTNLAARLCGEAKGGEILTNSRTLSEVEQLVEATPVGELQLKGLARPIAVASITGLAR